MELWLRLIIGLCAIAFGLYYLWHMINAKKKLPIKEGQIAPDFTLLDETKVPRSLHELRGSKVVVYFFPKSDTPGCTKEACSIRDTYDQYEEHNIKVLGISYDTPEELKSFKKKYHVPFTFLSDSSKQIARQYGAYQSSVNTLFPARITFLIDEKGKIVKIIENVNVATHAQDILNYFKKKRVTRARTKVSKKS